MKDFALGLDLGSNSVGWAMVAEQPVKGEENVIAGVRVFPEGTKREKGNESPRNAERRMARQMRRQHDRRARRKKKLEHVLREGGIEPLVHERGAKTGAAGALPDPYVLRRRGLDEALTLPEFGRVLMHLNQRRGFKSNAKTDDPKETGKVKHAIKDLTLEMEKAGARTLGEHLARLDPQAQRRRGRYTNRDMYESEFDLLWQRQAEFHASELTDELRERVRETIFYQRPLKPMDSRIGACELEPAERRCARASWFAHQFRILQEVNNLRVLSPGQPERELTADERRKLVAKLRTSKEVTVAGLRKMLGLRDIEGLNFEDTRRKGLDGNAVERGIRKAFAQYEKQPDKIDWLCRVVFERLLGEDTEVFRRAAKEEYGLSEAEIDALYGVPRAQGYASFSRKAIEKLIPEMEKGLSLDKAITAAGYEAREKDKCDLLPPTPEEINNPVVRRAMSEARKVVNAIVREYGKPARIVVELAREAKGSIRQRQEQLKKNNEMKARHEQIAGKLGEMGVKANHDNIEKYKLWEECEHVCPYTGKAISLEKLFGGTNEFQVEHIFPYDRSYDDSFLNLTLCDAHENRTVKGNKTPYEAYSGDPKRYDRILVHVNKLQWMPREKKRRFSAREIPEAFTRRQLVDTSYMARAIRLHLQRLGVPVATTRGAVTAELRWGWGLNPILSDDAERTRADHRHHAIDAVVIAMTTPRHIQTLGRRYQDRPPDQEVFPSPWDGFGREEFRAEVARAIEAINVSHRPQRRVSGAMHKETNYGLLRDGRYVHRVPLAALTPAQALAIVDDRVRELVLARLRERGVDPEAKGAKTPKGALDGLTLPSAPGKKSPPIKKVRIAGKETGAVPIQDRSGKVYRYVLPEGNHHVAIFEYTDAKGRTRRIKEMVTLFEACQRLRRQQQGESEEPVLRRTHPRRPEARFLFSLSGNDMALVTDKRGQECLCRVQTMTAGPKEDSIDVRFRHHTAATIDDGETMIRLSNLQPDKFRVKKVTVDCLGRIRDAHD